MAIEKTLNFDASEGLTLNLESGIAEDSETPIKACGCERGASCEHDSADNQTEVHNSGDGHNHGDSGIHAHDMIERFVVSGSDSQAALSTGISNSFSSADGQPSGETGAVYNTNNTLNLANDFSQGEFGITLNNIGGVGANSDAFAGFQAAADLWSYLIGDDVNITLDVGFSNLGPGVLGSTGSQTFLVEYSEVRDALADDALSNNDAAAVSTLSNGSSLSFRTQDIDGNVILDNNNSANNTLLSITSSNAKALGITTDVNGKLINPSADSVIEFNSSFNWDFDPTDGIDSGAIDFVGVAFHEIGHALGFGSGVDSVDTFHGLGPRRDLNIDLDAFGVFSVLDLFRYNSNGELDLRYGSSSFFSLDNGATNLGSFSTGAFQGDGDQASHWKDNLGLGILDPTSNPAGSVNNPSDLDLTAFDVIGWDALVDGLFFGDENGATTNGTSQRDLIDARAGNDIVNGFAGDDRLLGRQGNDTINGGAGNDILDGGVGNDILNGEAGNDFLIGSSGGDEIDGGTGIDTVSYADSNAAVTVFLSNKASTGGDAEGDRLTSIETLIASSHNDRIIGSNDNNRLEGGEGNDTLFGRAGNDVVLGGSGNDLIHVDTGDDIFDGGSGVDTITFQYSTTQVGFDLMVELQNGDSFQNFENVTGSAFNDTISGDAGANILIGLDGNDVLHGRDGNDNLVGGNGDDQFLGGQGADINNGGVGRDHIDYSNSAEGVEIFMGRNRTGSGGEAEGDTYVSIDDVTGSDHSDRIVGFGLDGEFVGGGGRDFLHGRNGVDVLSGGGDVDYLRGDAGNDILTGGEGRDIFAFPQRDFDFDQITDFELGVDRINFRNSGVTFDDLTIEDFAGGSAQITVTGTDNKIVIDGIAAAELSESNFIF